jgi:hypothetical protein
MRDEDISWADLHQQIQQNRVNFLNAELELANTLCGVAPTHHNRERQARLRRKIQEAIETVQHLAGRIDDSSIRRDILDRANDLECRAGSSADN